MTFDEKPTTILVPQESQAFYIDSKISAMNGFVKELEEYTGVAHTSFSIEELWLHYPDRPQDEPSLKQYLHNVTLHYPFYSSANSETRP